MKEQASKSTKSIRVGHTSSLLPCHHGAPQLPLPLAALSAAPSAAMAHTSHLLHAIGSRRLLLVAVGGRQVDRSGWDAGAGVAGVSSGGHRGITRQLVLVRDSTAKVGAGGSPNRSCSILRLQMAAWHLLPPCCHVAKGMLVLSWARAAPALNQTISGQRTAGTWAPAAAPRPQRSGSGAGSRRPGCTPPAAAPSAGQGRIESKVQK